MPQITVTLHDEVYWDLQNIPKGLKSKFVNEALVLAMMKCLSDSPIGEVCPAKMHAFARGKLGQYEEMGAPLPPIATAPPIESPNEKWMREQKEALE